MNKPPPPAPSRTRLQALLAIPERDRTEEQWDELNELEIMMAAGNRKVEAAHDPSHRGNPSAGRPNKPGGGGGGPPDHRKQGRKFHKRPPRRKP